MGLWATWSRWECLSSMQQGWARWHLKGPSNPNSSVVLWCYESMILWPVCSMMSMKAWLPPRQDFTLRFTQHPLPWLSILPWTILMPLLFHETTLSFIPHSLTAMLQTARFCLCAGGEEPAVPQLWLGLKHLHCAWEDRGLGHLLGSGTVTAASAPFPMSWRRRTTTNVLCLWRPPG